MRKVHRLVRSDLRSKETPRRVHGEFFSVAVVGRQEGVRATCAVSKAVSPKAVERNRIKRLCREVLRGPLGTLPAGAYVFSAKKGARGAAFEEIKEDLEGLLERLRGA